MDQKEDQNFFMTRKMFFKKNKLHLKSFQWHSHAAQILITQECLPKSVSRLSQEPLMAVSLETRNIFIAGGWRSGTEQSHFYFMGGGNVAINNRKVCCCICKIRGLHGTCLGPHKILTSSLDVHMYIHVSHHSIKSLPQYIFVFCLYLAQPVTC